jgi:centrin-3
MLTPWIQIAPKILSKDPTDDVLRSFELFASNKNYIIAEDVRRVADELGEQISDEEIQSMIEEFDLDGDGRITSEDFLEICLNYKNLLW